MSLYTFSVIDLKLGKVQPLESATAPASRLRRPASAPSLGFAPHQLSSKSVLSQLSAATSAKQRPATAAPRRAEEKARRLAIEKRLSAVPAHKQVVSHRHFPRHVWNPLGNAVAASAAAATQPGSPTWKARTHRLEREKLRRAFKWIDVNNDGMIDANELHAATARLGGTLTLRQVRDIIWEVDDDLNGKLSWDEFEAAYFRCQIDATGFAPRRFFFIAEFLLMDRDFSGSITLDEAMSVLFHRQGAGALEAATKELFCTANNLDSAKELSPQATISFDAFFQRFGCARPRIVSSRELATAYSIRAVPRPTSAPPRPPSPERAKSPPKSRFTPMARAVKSMSPESKRALRGRGHLLSRESKEYTATEVASGAAAAAMSGDSGCGESAAAVGARAALDASRSEGTEVLHWWGTGVTPTKEPPSPGAAPRVDTGRGSTRSLGRARSASTLADARAGKLSALPEAARDPAPRGGPSYARATGQERKGEPAPGTEVRRGGVNSATYVQGAQVVAPAAAPPPKRAPPPLPPKRAPPPLPA